MVEPLMVPIDYNFSVILGQSLREKASDILINQNSKLQVLVGIFLKSFCPEMDVVKFHRGSHFPIFLMCCKRRIIY